MLSSCLLTLSLSLLWMSFLHWKQITNAYTRSSYCCDDWSGWQTRLFCHHRTENWALLSVHWKKTSYGACSCCCRCCFVAVTVKWHVVILLLFSQRPFATTNLPIKSEKTLTFEGSMKCYSTVDRIDFYCLVCQARWLDYGYFTVHQRTHKSCWL